MKIEVVHTRTIVQTGGTQECKECEEEERLKKQQEQNLLEEDQVTLSGQSPLPKDIRSEPSEEGLENREDDEDGKSGLNAGVRPETELSEEEKRVLDELRARDREVRAHEQAHLAAAGPYAKGPPSFEYQTGPDGKRYAVGGEVQIDTSEVPGNPRATLVKAQTIKRAATAPQNPSAQDRQVAAQAARMEAEARREIQEERSETLNPAESPESENSIHSTSSVEKPPATSKIPQAMDNLFTPENSEDSSTANPQVKNALKQFISSSAPEKGNLLDTIS